MENHVIALRDGHNTTVMSVRDMLEIIDMYCGFDMRNLVRDGIHDLTEENEELEIENKDLQNTIDCNNEEERELLLSVRDECEGLLDELAQPRLSRRKLTRAVKTIYKAVNAEL